MPDGLHRHDFRGTTTFNDGHVHGYSGATSLNPDVFGHIHLMAGETSFNDGHTHRYRLLTGPGRYFGRRHNHYYGAFTSFDDGHRHYLSGNTSFYGR